MQYDVIVIGAGLSGLTAASLLAKQGLKTAVIEHNDTPGGSCGIFKRKDAIFDQGAAMLYGFGEKGFNSHRFVFNCLEENFEVIKHDLLYTVHYNGKKIRFWPNLNQFIEELSEAFPKEKKNINRFYKDMQKCYFHVISETPSYTTPDETNPKEALRSVLRHPLSYFRFLSYLNISAEKLLKKYFSNPKILHFFDKLTSTYCYATLAEAPAILASVMFIDNHEGGSYYPAGSTLFLPGKLEKVIEENKGDMYYNRTVIKLLFENDPLPVHSKSANTQCKTSHPNGVLLADGTRLYADNIIYSGTVWNLYDRLLTDQTLTEKERKWSSQVPTYPSVVLYTLVKAEAIPKNTCPIEMLAADPGVIDESEITLYILSIDDHTLCPPDQHVVIAIGPTLRDWASLQAQNTQPNHSSSKDTDLPDRYNQWKQEETDRILTILEKRFPGFQNKLLHCELATPHTIEQYTLKNGGSAAGPKQMLGQHMLLRQPIRTRWDSLFVCGDSTTMGTGTPTVTTSGIAAANAILKKYNLPAYVWKPHRKNYVQIVKAPVEHGWLEQYYPADDAKIMSLASKCRYCTNPSCCQKDFLNIPGIMRRITCGNFAGARKELDQSTVLSQKADTPSSYTDALDNYERNCIQNNPVEIKKILLYLIQKTAE